MGGGGERRNKKERKGERYVTQFLTKSCMFCYELNCITMCTSIIPIVNLPSE